MRIRTLLTAALLAALPLSGALAKDAALAKAVANEHRSPTLVANPFTQAGSGRSEAPRVRVNRLASM